MKGKRKKRKLKFGSAELQVGTTALTAINPIIGAAATVAAPAILSAFESKPDEVEQLDMKRDQVLASQEKLKEPMKMGGKRKRIFDSQNLVKGGKLKKLSSTAVQVDANEPNETDSVELPEAFVDHNEVISKNRVFSDSIKLPGSSMTIAKQAAKLEKMKSSNPRFADSNARIDEQLEELFESQEKSKMSSGGLMGQYKKASYVNGGGLSRSKDYGSSKKPYPSVKSGDFAGGGRSYPIPTKADAVDALRLAGLHGRSDVKAKVYRKYPGLKKGKAEGGEIPGFGKEFKYNFPDNPFNGLGNTTTVDTKGLLDAVDPVSNPPLYSEAVGSGPTLPDTPDTPDNNTPGTPPYLKPNPWTQAAAFLPNVANAFLQGQLKGPARPEDEREISLDRISGRDMIAQNTRDFRSAQRLITANTAQGSNLSSSIGNLLAKRFGSTNQIMGDIARTNAGIQNREAFANSQIRGRNLERRNAFRQARNDFSNQKKMLTSQNIASISNKLMEMGRERKMREKDLLTLDILKKAYGDSGVYQRNIQPIFDKLYGEQ